MLFTCNDVISSFDGKLLKDVRAKIFQSIEFFKIFTAGR